MGAAKTGIDPNPLVPSVGGADIETPERYVKILSQHTVPDIDPVAHGVASLGFGHKVREAVCTRAAFNPHVLGY